MGFTGHLVLEKSMSYIKDHQQMSLFVIFLYFMSQPYMFRASISPSSGVSLAVVTCRVVIYNKEILQKVTSVGDP